MILLAVLIAVAATVGLMIVMVSIATVSGQTSNREEMEKVREEFGRIVDRLGEEEGDPP